MNSTRLLPALFIALAPLPAAASVPGESLPGKTVFDSLLVVTSGGVGSTAPGTSLGQKVHLGGTARRVTQLEIRVVSLYGTILAADEVWLSLFDGTGEVVGPAPPGPLLWEGPADSVTAVVAEYDQPGTVYRAALPAVQVPDSVAWTVEVLTPNRQFLLPFIRDIPPFEAEPHVGRQGEAVYLVGDIWGPGSRWSYPAWITAIVPEPSGSVLAVVSVLALGRGKRLVGGDWRRELPQPCPLADR